MATANSKLLIDFGFDSRGTSNVSGDLDITGSLAVGGNLSFSGTTVGNFIPDQDQRSLGNTVNRWNLQGYVANIASTLTVAGITTLQNDVTLSKTLSSGNTTIIGFANISTSVNSALLTVGTSFIANTSGVFHTGIINSSSFTTSGLIANTTALVATSNTVLLGNSTGRFVLSANTGNFSGDVTISGNTTVNNAILNGTLQTISGNVNFDSGVLFVDATNNRVGIANTSPGVALEVSGSANISGSVNTSLLTVGSSLIANTTAIVPTSNTILLGNSTGRFILSANSGTFSGAVSGITTLAAGNTTVTGFANVTTLAAGNTTVTGFANVSTSIQGGSSLTIAGAASGITTLAAGNTTVTGFANVTGTIQGGSSLTIAGAASGITTLATGNTTVTGFVNSTSTVNAASFSVGSSFIANSTQVTVAAGVPLSANGSTGTVGHALYSNGSIGSPYWSTAVTSVASGNGLSGGPITTTGTLSVVAGSGIISNTTGVFVNASSIAVGTVPAATLGSGTANSTTFLAGDQSFKVVDVTSGARAAVSFVAGSGAYNSSTGVFTIPTNTSHLTNGAGFITGITSGNVTTALGFTPYNSTNPSGFISSVPNASTQVSSLGVGTAASGTTGEIRATGNITAGFSDDRLKNKIGPILNALDKVNHLSGFYYRPNDIAISLGYNDCLEVGVSAQQVNEVQPETVAPAPIDNKYLTVRYERLVPLLIEAIKELKNEVDNLKNQINEINNGNKS